MSLSFRKTIGILAPACINLPFFAAAGHGAPNLPEGALALFGRVPFHSGCWRIEASELSPDGKLLATLGRRSATVWDTTTGQIVHRFFFDIPWSPSRMGLAFSPDGKWLATRATSDRIVIWNLTTGKEFKRFNVAPTNFDFAFFRFSSDGKALIAQVNEDVVWLSVETGAVERRLSDLRIKQLSRDDKTFAVVDEKKRQVHVGDARTGKIIRSLSIAARYRGRAEGLLFLPDGVTLAAVHYIGTPTTGAYLKEVQLWDLTTGKRRKTWSIQESDYGESYPLLLSPDAKVLYFLRENLRRFSLETFQEFSPILLAGGSGIWEIFLHPNGKTLFSIHLEEIRRWDLATGEQISKDDFIEWRDTAISPDGRWLVLGAYQGPPFEGPVELWDTESRKVKRIQDHCGNGRTFAFSPCGETLAISRYDHLQFLRVPELTEIKKLKLPETDNNQPSIYYGAFYLAWRSSVGRMYVYDLKTDKEVLSLEEVAAAVFTPDSNSTVSLFSLMHP